MWNIAKAKDLGYFPSLKEGLNEFRVGYIGTAFLALGFLSMGAMVMYGTGEELAQNGTKFSEQLINMYTTSLGEWAYWIVSIAAVATMISTSITVLDAYPRALTPAVVHLFGKKWSRLKNNQTITWAWLAIIFVGTMILIIFAVKSMGVMVTIATTISFLVAPILAWLNYRVVTDKHMPKGTAPGLILRVLSWIGIVFFMVFSLVYIYWKIMV